MNINNKELKKLTLLKENTQGGTVYLKDNYLYKIINDPYFFSDEILRNINYQKNNPIPNTPIIYDKIYIDNIFIGYIMEYITNSITFSNAINNNITTTNKLKAIKDIYTTIKYLHSKNILLGDIHLNNLLINSNGRGYIIDLDYLIYPEDKFKFNSLYLIKQNNNSSKINLSSTYTDNIKAFLCSLSLLLNINIEEYIDKTSKDINIEYIYNNIVKKYNNKILNNYLENIIKGNPISYFDDYILKKYYNKKSKSKKISLK